MTEGVGAMSEWYSDRALDKQRVADEKLARGELLTVADLTGAYEARVPPNADERCAYCGSDARDEVGGEESHGKRWCPLCIGRRHDAGYS